MPTESKTYSSADLSDRVARTLRLPNSEGAAIYGELALLENGPIKSALDRLCPQSPLKIMLDVDDVLWDLNGKAAKQAGVPYQKITTYSIRDNPILSKGQKDAMLEQYTDPGLHDEMRFFRHAWKFGLLAALPFIDLHVVSNSCSEQSAAAKRRNLETLFGPLSQYVAYDIHVIDFRDSHKKKFPADLWLAIDDSPFNIKDAGAKNSLMPPRPWNTPENMKAQGCGSILDMPGFAYYGSLEDCQEMVFRLLRAELGMKTTEDR